MLSKYIMFLFSWDEHECDVDLRRSCLCGRLVLYPVQGYWPIQHVDEQEAQYVASSIYQKLLSYRHWNSFLRKHEKTIQVERFI